MKLATHGSTVALSPDGRFIAYSNHDEGERGVYVRPAAQGAPGKWQISTGPARHPRWSRTAPQLLYQDTEGHVMVVDYTVQGGTFSPGPPRLWVAKQFSLGIDSLPGRVFELAPDGKRILATVEPGPDEGVGNLHVSFIVNFFDELQRRLPNGTR